MSKEPSSFNNFREKYNFSLLSEKFSAKCIKNQKLPIKINNFKDNQKFPLIISPNFKNKQETFIFSSPKKKIISELRKKCEFYENSYLSKNIDFTIDFPMIRREQNNSSSKTFHFLEEIENSKKPLHNSEISIETSDIKSFNKYLPFLSICNKKLLDMKKKNNEKSNFFKNPSFHQNKNVFITNFDGNPKEKFQLKNMVLNKEDPDKIKNKFEVSYDNSKLGTANLKFKKLHYKKIIKIHNSEDKKPNKKELNYQKIRQDNLINQDKIRSKKNQSLMEFAETIDHIINDQRKKINSLVKNVSDKFEDVIKRS